MNQTIDVRPMPPPERHEAIRGLLVGLATGETPRLVNDHDPAPLHYQLDVTRAGQFRWAYAESGPETRRSDITSTARLSVVVRMDPDAAADRTLAELDLDDDLAVLDLWAAVAEEFGERSLGDLEPLEPRPATLGQLAEAFRAALSP